MGPAGVIDNGALCIDAGIIRHVVDLNAAPDVPAAFEDAPRIRSGDTIYPGLIELHNHLCYNAIPLWDVPRRFTNSGQWKIVSDYRTQITKPAQVLGATEGVVEALVRWVECRSLLGGVTTSQGVTLISNQGIASYFEGLVRNVESPGDPAFPAAGTRIGNVSAGDADRFFVNLQRYGCYLQHLSEGIDDTARGWFHNLQLADHSWALTDAFCGVHSTALAADDFAILRDHGGSMVWSPLSNYLLYGETVDIRAAKEAGLVIGLGSDWAPSGSKNLLGEMKVAWLASQALAGPDGEPLFSPEEILAMATRNAAQILRWETLVGTLQPGRRADLMLLNGQAGDPYLQAITARETTITVVLIDGVPRVGQRWLMGRFGLTAADVEAVQVGRSDRWLYLAQDQGHPLVGALSLGEATNRLEEALANLPVLAAELDDLLASGLFGGSAGAAGDRAVAWRVFLDFEPEEDPALASGEYAEYVTAPMALEGITVADDPAYLAKLVAARNLPAFVKEGLPPLYGEVIPLPPAARFLEEESDALPENTLETTGDLRTFLRTWGELSLDQRREIVAQALVMLEDNYVHLPFKRARYAVDPLQRLRLLAHHLAQMTVESMPPEIEFHNELSRLFADLRDLHTSYRLPRPFRGRTAWLPFMVEAFWEEDRRRYLVSHVVGQPGPESFRAGVELLYWNGTPIDREVTQLAERMAGSNPAARQARAVSALTLRPLTQGLPPDEEWVTLRYRDAAGQVHEWTQEWLVFAPANSALSAPAEVQGASREGPLGAVAAALGLDPYADELQVARRALYGGPVVRAEQALLLRDEAGFASLVWPVENVTGGLETFLPSVFRASPIIVVGVDYGYVRIFTFNVADAVAFVDEFVRLARRLPENGLIIDVRGNGGGLIHAAERLLQVLTPRRIEPQQAQFLNTPLNLTLCRRHAPSQRFTGLDLSPWIPSLDRAVETGAAHSLGYPITSIADCNDLGQAYYGPVVLVVDALCYSATDMFAAGFQDHAIGPILGVDEQTGGGGANVWSHSLLRALLPADEVSDSPYAPLPHGADLRLAVRRTLRVGPNEGLVLEDYGVRPDVVHRMTRADLLEHNVDLTRAAARLLAKSLPHVISTTRERNAAGALELSVTTRNISRLDIFCNGRPWRSIKLTDDPLVLDPAAVAADLECADGELELRGYQGQALVAVRREAL
jgi:cytosine/adenosine deaminase-related metal-dependent hydrolase